MICTGDASGIANEWVPIRNRVKAQMGQVRGKEKTLQFCSAGTQNLTEMAATLHTHCTHPLGSCGKKVTRAADLLHVTRGHRTYNVCFDCWVAHELTRPEMAEQVNELSGLGVTGKGKIFRLLKQKVSLEEATRVVYDPACSTEVIGNGRKTVQSARKRAETPAAKYLLSGIGLSDFKGWVNNIAETGIKHTPGTLAQGVA